MHVILRPRPLLTLLLWLLVGRTPFPCCDQDGVGCLVLVQCDTHLVDGALGDLDLAQLLLSQLQNIELAHLLVLSIRGAFGPVLRRSRGEGARYLLGSEESGAGHLCVALTACVLVLRIPIHVKPGICRITGLLHLAEVVPLVGSQGRRVGSLCVHLAHQVRQVDAWSR